MEKNTLLENIKRIHQIIGIKPNILIESEINRIAENYVKYASWYEKD